jgi:hypothetical protein
MISQEKSEFVRSLADANGHIEPADVIEAARSPKSPIHGDFEWDESIAAQAYLFEQARRLIRLVKIEVTIDHRTFHSVAYVVDPDRERGSRRYVDLTIAAQRRSTAEQIILMEMGRIIAGIRRAQQIAGVCGLSKHLEALLENATKIQEAVMPGPPSKKQPPKKGRRRRESAEARA